MEYVNEKLWTFSITTQMNEDKHKFICVQWFLTWKLVGFGGTLFEICLIHRKTKQIHKSFNETNVKRKFI